MSRNFDPDKPVRYFENGEYFLARIVCKDMNRPDYSILALVSVNGRENPYYFNEFGESPLNTFLENIPEKRPIWLNVYSENSVSHNSRKDADDNASPSRIACVKVEFEEGEGL